jgi:hypothetical protein
MNQMAASIENLTLELFLDESKINFLTKLLRGSPLLRDRPEISVFNAQPAQAGTAHMLVLLLGRQGFSCSINTVPVAGRVLLECVISSIGGLPCDKSPVPDTTSRS